MLPLRWFLVLVGVFVLTLGVDLTVSRAVATSATAREAERITVSELFAAASADQLAAGSIVYRGHALGLADLNATLTTDSAAPRNIRAVARLTDTDLALLRSKGFTEEDAASAAAAKTLTLTERTAKVAHGAVHPIGLLVLIAGLVVVVQRFGGRFTAFSTQRLRPAASSVKFSSVAGCDEAKDEVHEVVEFLRDPARFRETGGRMPKGVLLVGPPGTGKNHARQGRRR